MTRTLFVGIDGCSWRVLDRLDLPTIDDLLGDAVRGTLRSTSPPITFPAWKAITTGTNPGKLGVFGFANFDRSTRSNRINDATHFDVAELWDYVGDEGGRSAVVNVPTTYPPHDPGGAMVAGPNVGDGDLVAPAEADRYVTGYRRLGKGERLAFKAGGDRASSVAERVIDSRFETASALLDGVDPTLLAVGIYCTDTLQHYYWDGDEVAAAYRTIDDGLAALLDRLERHDDDWNVVIASDHGFRPIEGALYLDTWLEREGFLTTGTDDDTDPRHALGLTTENAYRVVEALGLGRLVERLPDRVVGGVADALVDGADVPVVDAVDWDRTDAVFLNGGIYALGDDRRATAEAVADALRDATAPDGTPLVDEIHRAEDVYSGPHADLGPDLVPISDGFKLMGLSRDGRLVDADDDWVAGHEMEGVFAATGPDFGTADDVALDCYDLAPTVLHAMGHGVPEDVDGTVRRDLLAGAAADDEIATRPPLPSPHGSRSATTDEDRIQDRLEELGYV